MFADSFASMALEVKGPQLSGDQELAGQTVFLLKNTSRIECTILTFVRG